MVKSRKPLQLRAFGPVKGGLCTKLSTGFVDRIKMTYETAA